MQLQNSAALPWTLADIPFADISREKVCGDEQLFFVLASASLVEAGSDLYTRNLVEHFGDDSAVGLWLAGRWEQEELQHGRALRTYVEYAWPEFDWELADRRFLAEYSRYCSMEELEHSRALELAARCVVETGTATLYRAIHDYTDEPVLKNLTARIRADEVRHFKYFYRYFNEYNDSEGNGRWRILDALLRRIHEIRGEDADCALRHVYAVRYPGRPVDSADFRNMSTLARTLVMRNASADMMVKMFLKPLDLPARLQPFVRVPLAKAMQRFLLH